ncbi:hypothetical protein [Streptomyces sp. NRRL S-495]|uniref:hypothetical protein n=1 Tax=Streptomyces sp. NRRL S-495 TaxID=1609133 RepID=UPI0005F8D35E|nr:hypothetical protein [Streptomyces sp. NRRL S-495]KJY29288.1 hypothetical protein VR45_30335 [Streptomyces sp. NRRL S-495]
MPAVPSQNSLPSFDEELCGLVLDTAPRQFAVVQVYDAGGQDADGWVAAWGFADDNGVTHLLVVDGRTRMTLASPERALCLFAGRPGLSARLVWLARPGAAALDRAEAA